LKEVKFVLMNSKKVKVLRKNKMDWKDLRMFIIVSPRHLDQEWGHDSSGRHLLS
jgi:hypothetical protein